MTRDSVECPECGEEFDATKAGGWCTNPDCGEYRHVEGTEETSEESTGGEERTGTATGASAGDSSGESSREQSQPVEKSESSGAGQDNQEVTCPDCEKKVPDKNFCMNCGAELDAKEEEPAQEAHQSERGGRESKQEQTEQHSSDSRENAGQQRETRNTNQQTGDGGQEKPESGMVDSETDSGPDGQEPTGQGHDPRLSEQGADEPEGEDTTEQQDSTTSTESREQKPVDESPSSPDRVVIEVGSDHIRVRDGESVGSEIRSAYVDDGGDSTEAQYISREHIQVESRGGQFYVEDVSTNGTKLNGERLEEDEPRPVEDGDTLNFAGVTEGKITIE